MSATAVLPKPRRRNNASAASMMRTRVSSGLLLTCALTNPALRMTSDENHNSSVLNVKGLLAARLSRRRRLHCPSSGSRPLRPELVHPDERQRIVRLQFVAAIKIGYRLVPGESARIGYQINP